MAVRSRAGFGSSAETALRAGWPVVLVLNVGGQAQSAAAAALGFKLYNPDLPFAGVILNKVASPRHERLTRLGMDRAGIEVLGAAPACCMGAAPKTWELGPGRLYRDI